MIRAEVRGSEPIGSHQKYLLSSSARNSGGQPYVGDFSMISTYHDPQNQTSQGTETIGEWKSHHRLDARQRGDEVAEPGAADLEIAVLVE